MAASLYDMLTGFAPRDFDEDHDPWLTILETDPVPIRRRGLSLPPLLAEVIDEAMKEAPALRFPTASAFRDALEEALRARRSPLQTSHQPIRTCPRGAAGRAARRRGRVR